MAGQEIFEAQISTASFPPRLPGNKLALRYKVKSLDLNQTTQWSPVYYIDGPTIANTVSNTAISSTLTKLDSDSFTIKWKDPNVVKEYDVFAAFSIDCDDFTVTRRSVLFDKYLYSSDTLFRDEISTLYVGAKIDAVGISSAINGSELVVQEIQTVTAPYYIRFTGDSSDNLANTTPTPGYIILSKTSITHPRTSQSITPYQYVATVPRTGEANIFSFQAKKVGTAGKQSERAQVFIQVACSNKTADTSLFIVESNIASLV